MTPQHGPQSIRAVGIFILSMRPQHDRNEQNREKRRDNDTLKSHMDSPLYYL